MADNEHYYGFRPYTGNPFTGGVDHPKAIPMSVASGYSANEDGGSSIDLNLNIGDPVELVNDGTVALANTTDAVFGVIASFGYYYNGSRMAPTNYLPNGSTWSGEQQRPTVYVIPASACLWEIDVDDASTATTEAAYRALVNENCSFVCPGDSDTLKAEPRLDISTHDTTAGLECRIVDISKTEHNRDFSGANVKLVIAFNKTQSPGQAATTIAGV